MDSISFVCVSFEVELNSRPDGLEAYMNRPISLRRFTGIAATLALVLWGVLSVSHAQQVRPAVAIDPDDIGGVVTGPSGPEAGVWVIAETRDLQVRYIKSV